MYEKALSLLESEYYDKNISNDYYNEKYYRYKLICYEKKEQYSDFIKLSVSLFLLNKHFLERIPLESISEKIFRTRNERSKKSVLTPIFAFISKNKKNIRRAFSNFIDSNNIENINDLLSYNFESARIKELFFYNICTIDVLKRDYKFGESIEEVYKSRLSILKEITQLSNNKQYLDEMMSITSKMKIREHTEQINNNRIYVDVERIKKENSVFLKEDFDKYIVLKDYDLDLIGIDLNDNTYIEKFKQIYDETNMKSKQDANYKQNLLLLKSILERITYDFLFNSKYGLDTFLSARIRHGYCKDQLSKVFKEQHLLSKKTINKSNDYLVNEYWDEVLVNCPDEVKKNIKESLSKFTDKIELKIREVKDEWIRIRIKESDIGLFDYVQFVEACSVIIDRERYYGDDFNIFYDVVISSLWDWTNERLAVIRGKISNDLLKYFIESLRILEEDIDIYSNNYHSIISRMKNNINICKKDIAIYINEFSNIFYKNDVEYKKFKINDAVRTSEQLFQQLYPFFTKIVFKKNIVCNQDFKGQYFPFFIDIFNILISNCIQHSGIENYENLYINMLITELDNDEKKNVLKSFEKISVLEEKSSQILRLTVENNLGDSIDCNELKNTINLVYKKIRSKENSVFKEYTQSEGGTGLMKLTSILKYNMNTTHGVSYDIDKSKKKFLINVDIVIKKGEDNSENIIC